MTVFMEDRDLTSIQGTFLKPESILNDEWKNLKKEQEAVLLLPEGASSCAIALKVWPDLKRNIRMIVIAGGTLKRGDVSQWAEKNIAKDPYAVESLLNSGIPVAFALKETAEACKMNNIELAEAYIKDPDSFTTAECGVHIELQKSSPAYGKLVADINSDKKFSRKNAVLILSN